MENTALHPELTLREYIQTNKAITKKGNLLYFSDSMTIKADTPTPFIQSSTKKNYTIGSIWFYLKFKDEQLTSYMNQCRKEKMDSVTNRDKNDIIQFFIHGVDDVEIYDKGFTEKQEKLLGQKRENERIEQDNKQKKEIIAKTENKVKIQSESLYEDPNLAIIDYITTHERNNINRNSILRIPYLKFENIVKVCRKKFMKGASNNEERRNQNFSFLDELLNNESKILLLNI